jgi:hypothetical protein
VDETSLVAGFEDRSLSPEALGHREHVHIAWVYLRRMPFETAAPLFCTNLRLFAAAHGAEGRFHATITWAYLALVNERLHRGSGSSDFEVFAAENADLFDHEKGALATLYDRATLESPLARRVFVLPC